MTDKKRTVYISKVHQDAEWKRLNPSDSLSQRAVSIGDLARKMFCVNPSEWLVTGIRRDTVSPGYFVKLEHRSLHPDPEDIIRGLGD